MNLNPDEIRYDMEKELAWAEFYTNQAEANRYDTAYAATCRKEAEDARKKAWQLKAQLDALEADGKPASGGYGTG